MARSIDCCVCVFCLCCVCVRVCVCVCFRPCLDLCLLYPSLQELSNSAERQPRPRSNNHGKRRPSACRQTSDRTDKHTSDKFSHPTLHAAVERSPRYQHQRERHNQSVVGWNLEFKSNRYVPILHLPFKRYTQTRPVAMIGHHISTSAQCNDK